MNIGLKTTGFLETSVPARLMASTPSHLFNFALYLNEPTAFTSISNLLFGTRLTRTLGFADAPETKSGITKHITAAKTTNCLTRILLLLISKGVE
jgi:hypothetical protein